MQSFPLHQGIAQSTYIIIAIAIVTQYFIMYQLTHVVSCIQRIDALNHVAIDPDRTEALPLIVDTISILVKIIHT